MRVMKFGGTSVGSAVQIRKVAGLIGNKSPKNRCIVGYVGDNQHLGGNSRNT